MKKKLYTLIALVFTAVSFTSCLDIDPESELTDQTMWQSEGTFDAFVIGVHSEMRAKAWNFFRLGEVRSDIYSTEPSAKFGGVASKVERFAKNTLDETNPGISDYAGLYYNINQMNLFIYKAKNSPVLSDSKRNYYLGQMYGMRAYYYFHLLRSWNNVVWTEEPSLDFEIGKLDRPVTPAAEIMVNIKKDIDQSLEYFGTDYSFKSKSHWSKAASLMLKAETYLWSSRQMDGGQQDAQTALTALNDIKTNVSGLKLMDTFKEVFAYNKKENAEIIFALHYAEDAGEDNMFNGEYRMNYCLMKGDMGKWYDIEGNKIDTKVDNFDGVGYYFLNDKLFKEVFNEKDTRCLATIKPLFNENKEFIANIPYKYQGKTLAGQSVRTMCDDYPVYRYADLLLMVAEAKSLTGGDPTAEINEVRARAYGENYNEEIAYPNQEIDADVNEAILHERFCEFVLEGKRWYDLRRFGNEYVFKYSTANEQYPLRLIWPIDRETMVRNPAIHQTEGYETTMQH